MTVAELIAALARIPRQDVPVYVVSNGRVEPAGSPDFAILTGESGDEEYMAVIPRRGSRFYAGYWDGK